MSSSASAMRTAFTMIELVIVLAIMIVVSLAAIPGIMAASQRASVKGGIVKMQSVIAEAQRLARRQTPRAQVLTAAAHYGVALVSEGGAPYATILYGRTASDELVAADGTPINRATLPAALEASWAPASPRLAWFFQYGSGRPIQSPAAQSPVDIGTAATEQQDAEKTGTDWGDWRYFRPYRPAIAASPVATSIQLRQHSGRLGMAIAMYSNGLIAVSGLE